MERYYTISEVIEATHIPRRTCYDAVASGLLRVVTKWRDAREAHDRGVGERVA